MAHPWQVLVPVLAALLVLGIPFTRLQQAVPDAAVFPASMESRDAAMALERDFPAGETTPIVVLADMPGDPFSAGNLAALGAYDRQLAAVAGVDRVEGLFRNPLDGSAIPVSWYVAPPSAQVAAGLEQLKAAYVRGSTVRFDAISPREALRPAATGMIPGIRSIDPGAGIRVTVGGAAAGGYDFLASMSERVPWAVGTTLVAMLVVLFLLFGSVVLPIKAVFMTLLSLTASFGALVWIFQEGNLSGLLHFESPGYTVAGNPILMFAVLFGLSMDYEVLLLSRIQEAYRRTGDNRESVAEGLSRTAAVITGAAMVMVIVFAAFALAQIITIKSLGVGMAIAVFVDATIIRVLLVPATMRLMGHWNWWAPGPLGRLADRLGFGHVEDEGEPPQGGGEAREAPVPARGWQSSWHLRLRLRSASSPVCRPAQDDDRGGAGRIAVGADRAAGRCRIDGRTVPPSAGERRRAIRPGRCGLPALLGSSPGRRGSARPRRCRGGREAGLGRWRRATRR